MSLTELQQQVFERALQAHELGLAALPPKADGSKGPDLVEWTTYQERLPTRDEIDGWFKHGRDGIELVCGPVSGNLTLLDFDEPGLSETFIERAEEQGLGELVLRVVHGYYEATPKAGTHLLWRCAEACHSLRLAGRLVPDDKAKSGTRIQTLIETKGVGGLVVIAPSAGHTHPLGTAYTLYAGGLDTIETITPAEQDQLLVLAQSFDELPKTEPRSRGTTRTDGELRPGDDFNEQADWDEILEGWLPIKTLNGVTYWRKPNSSDGGHHATTNYGDSDLLYVFSTATLFEPNRSYDKFGAYATLHHGGDHKKAAADLNDQGFGEDRRNGYVAYEPDPEPEPEPDAPPPPGAREGPASEPGEPQEQQERLVWTLIDVVAVFQKWLYLDSLKPLYATLGSIAANYARGDPVWLLIVGGSGSGKTELVMAARYLDHVKLVATMTEAALLSGTPRKSVAAGSKGGLLREIGVFGILLLKDFTSVLSMSRDPRTALLGALREIFDGYWVRRLGVDGGKTLEWEGKVGFVAGCTSVIDSHHAVLAAMGERFLFARLPEISEEEQAARALKNVGKEAQMRKELAEAVTGLFASLGDLAERTLEQLTPWESQHLITLSTLVARSRSAVERDSYNREIQLILDPEAPARLVQTLSRLYGGMLAVGLDRPTAWQVTVDVGLDSIPKLRRQLLEQLFKGDDPIETSALATAIGYPTMTTRRALEDLAAHHLVQREKQGQGRPDAWEVTARVRQQWALLQQRP